MPLKVVEDVLPAAVSVMAGDAGVAVTLHVGEARLVDNVPVTAAPAWTVAAAGVTDAVPAATAKLPEVVKVWIV